MDSLLLGNFFQGASNVQVEVILTILAVWSLAWKGFSLYHAARHEEKLWFVALLFVNTVGLLEIAYLFFISKDKVTMEDMNIYWSKLKNIRGEKLIKLVSRRKSKQ